MSEPGVETGTITIISTFPNAIRGVFYSSDSQSDALLGVVSDKVAQSNGSDSPIGPHALDVVER